MHPRIELHSWADLRGYERATRSLARTLAAALGLLTGVAQAQTTGGMAGQIVDASTNHGISDAIVVATSPSLAGERGAQTNARGDYRIDLLPPGTYALSVRREGFVPGGQAGIRVKLSPFTTVRIKLQETTDPSTLPLAGHSWQDLAILAPGASNGDFDTHFDPCATRVQTTEIRGKRWHTERDWELIAISCPPSLHAGWRGRDLRRYAIEAQSLGSGNFDGDGDIDLAVINGAQLSIWSSLNETQVIRLQSIPLQSSYPAAALDPGVTGVAPVTLGAVLVSGRRNADQYDDLLVGLPEATVGGAAKAGVVLEFLGSSTGLPSKPTRIFRRGALGLPGRPTANERFGAQVALVDFDGNGVQNLLIGCPYCYNGTGAFWAELSNRTFFGQTIGGGNRPASYFGWAFSGADLDGDAYRDFVVGAPGLDAGSLKNAGAIYGYAGAATTPIYRGAVAAPATLLVQATPIGFGASLDAFDATHAGTDQIFVGSPCLDLPGKKDAGGVVPVTLGGTIFAPFHLDRGTIPGEAHPLEYVALPNGSNLLTRATTLTALCAGN